MVNIEGFGSLLRSFRVNKSTNQLMCRDLNGRRLASIDEERKLKKWIEKAAEREKEREMKRKAKYEKLKAGDPKHMFDDPEYIQQREEILEKTEDAFEKGLVQYRKVVGLKKVESSSDSDFDIDCLPGNFGRKRKVLTKTNIVEKKRKELKVESSDESSESDLDENEADPDLIKEIEQYFLSKEESGHIGTSKSADAMIGMEERVGISDDKGNDVNQQ
uniref:Replication stress response regulator SDE2 n=1 Tax=Heterorhabditis bacteriophora TaxID=37862 RepID=A0A1I7XLL9_HETBA